MQGQESNRPTLPIADGKETVKARFETSFTDWDDFIAQITLAPFQVRGLNGFVFEVNQAYLDF